MHCSRGQRRKQLQPEGVTLPAVFWATAGGFTGGRGAPRRTHAAAPAQVPTRY